MSNKIVNLHCHTQASHLDGHSRIDEFFARVKKLGQPSAGLSEHGVLSSIFDARKTSLKYGIKFIPGIEQYFTPDLTNKKSKRNHITLLAYNEKGYRNLLKSNYEAFLNFQYVAFINKVFPRIDWELLEKYSEGMICLSGCGSGILSKALLNHNEEGILTEEENYKDTINKAKRLHNIFGNNFYLEVQPHTTKVQQRNRKTGDLILNTQGEPITIIDQKYVNEKLIEIGKELNIKLVATGDCHYTNQSDSEFHDMLIAIASKSSLDDPTRQRYDEPEFYLKHRSEFIKYFTKLGGLDFAKEVCDNTLKINEQCEEPEYIDPKGFRFPKFDTSQVSDYKKFRRWYKGKKFYNTISEDSAYLRYKCINAFTYKFGDLKGEEKKKYKQRLEKEIKVLEKKNFSSYMLVVADYLAWARKQDILYGDRGSVAGSLVAYLLEIHSVDPLKYGLIFERFQNEQKEAFPDIDTDFDPDSRDLVKEYITQKYGKDKVAHVSNLSTITAKVAVKDIARSLNLGGSKSEAFKIANKITDTIPDGVRSIGEAIKRSGQFRKYCQKYPDLKRFGEKIVGRERNWSTHAGGILIGDIELASYIPLRVDKNGLVAAQYEKNRCEKMGLIKMDLLGLEHLRIISNTLKNIKKMGKGALHPKYLPLDDKNVWKSISDGHTMCIFQMESPLYKNLCKRVQPKNILDLSLINAIGRPGPSAYADTYIKRRHGKEPVSYKYKCLKNALKDTLGVCIYEEQLAFIARDVAGWNLNKADGLRKLTKMKEKGAELAAQLKNNFIKDVMEYSKFDKNEAFDLWNNVIEPFSGYGFPRAHSVVYSINGYQSAYYKYYYPSEFMAAVLKSEAEKNSSPSRDYNLKIYKKEAKRLGINIKIPDINKSDYSFVVDDDKNITTGFSSIKGVGVAAIKNILETKKEHSFKSYQDFLFRTSSRLVRKNVIQALAKSGCFDSFGISRKGAHDCYDIIRKATNTHAKKIIEEGRKPENILNDFKLPGKIDIETEWDKKQKLDFEMETMGEYISGNINDIFGDFFSGKGIEFAKLRNAPDNQKVKVEAVILDVKQKKIKKGKNKGKVFAKCSITDRNGHNVQMTVWTEQFLKYNIKEGVAIKAICRVNEFNEIKGLILSKIIQERK